ncbi:hypothetical protein Cob_v005934 [Colletotrichum orbiculare MAFF 240422]|uniref:Uncharacterized protein n=1 Tax=Colletotrichum orbiculare (strain 104-T / ATCC 96160 / CBS 514.97 / LARS 414 / MAFF 240422) TaxID=1213857 RepID=A0A484FTD2_COLOR|nr:hypothetical protein Cob_v005934 [Colletotrichum orbiculare MAFF 240422]
MAISTSIVNRKSEVMVISSDSGPPRLDLDLARGRRGTFSSFDSDGEKGLFPRTARSSNDLFAQALSRIETTDSDSEWGAVRARARENNDRQGMSDLIDFLRTTSPPPQLPEQHSVFDDDTEPQDDDEEPERWRLFKKLRRPRTRARSESPARRPRTAGLPNSAVASKTASGNSHIAISIPLEYCHVGPDSDWALAIFNATPPLPTRVDGDANDAPRPYASERTVTVLKTVSEKGSVSPIDTESSLRAKPQGHCKRAKGSVSIWPKINPTPMNPPKTPYTTPPGSLHGKPSVSRKKHERMPALPPQYAELPASPVLLPQSPEDKCEKSYWLDSDAVVPPQPAQPTARPRQSQRRPENITLPPRRSSTKIVKPIDAVPDKQRSTDGMMGSRTQRQSIVSDAPQLSPGYSEVPSLSPSIATTELSEPVVSSARSAKAYSTASIILQDTPILPSLTPRQSFSVRPGSSDTAQTTLVNESVASRNPSTRTAASRQSRKDRVKSLKQRDMEALRALTHPIPQEDGEITPRPTTSETVISSLRLPSRDGTFGSRDNLFGRSIETKLSATNLANMAKSQETSHGPTKISSWQATQEVETPGWETASENLTSGWATARETPTSEWASTPLLSDTMAAADSAAAQFDSSLARDSTISSEPPRRWGSFHRTSWASSVPLLDRIGSFAPSDASFARVGEGFRSQPPRLARMSRADSATLSQFDSDRLASPRESLLDADARIARDFVEAGQSIAGSIAAFPKPGTRPRLSAIMPVAEVIPTDERWSASTLNSPMTVVEVSHPPFATNTTTQVSSQLARLHTAGDTAAQPSTLRRQPTPDDGDDTATLRPKSRSQETPANLASMSSRELRSHYATLRNARVNDLAHEMLVNQERLEMRMHQTERNQMIFIERLERCMHELRSLPGSPFLGARPLDWPCNDAEFVYEEQRTSRDDRQEVRVRKSGRRVGHLQHRSESSHRHRQRLLDEFGDFDGDFHDRRPRRPSTSHNVPLSRRSTGRSQHAGVPALPPLIKLNSLDAMDPLMRELQLAARVSQETNRTERTETSQLGGPNDYFYNMI